MPGRVADSSGLQPAAPRGIVRIAALGDSTTAGTPAFQSPVEAPPSGKGNPTSQFAYWLERARPHWRVANKGVNGERIDQIAARFDRDVLGESPAVVIILAGVNDIYLGRPARDVIARLDTLYGRARAASLPVVAATILPYDTATAAQNAAMHEVNTWIATQAASDPNVWFCDTRAAVGREGAPDMLESSTDGLHPSVAGYMAMATALLPVLDRLLARPSRVGDADRVGVDRQRP